MLSARAESGSFALCGENLSWTITDEDCDGAPETIYIEGEGAMYDYTASDPAPWKNCGVTAVFFSNDVTSIGDRAFYGCDKLEAVVLPTGVTSIGASAFNGCSALMEAVLPESVVSIGNYAFSGCASLTSVILPTGMTALQNLGNIENLKMKNTKRKTAISGGFSLSKTCKKYRNQAKKS